MSGEVEDSNKYEGQDLCTIDDVYDEIGPVLSKQSSTVFPDDRRDQIIGRWIQREQAKFYQFTAVLHSQLKGNMLLMSRDAVLFRVVVRVLKKIQTNRTQRAGGVPTYQQLIEFYNNEQEMLEHNIRGQFRPQSKDLDQPYPLSFEVKVIVIDDTTEEELPGARIFVNNEWLATSWKDGEVAFPLDTLAENEDAYDVQVKMVGYEDSTTQEIDEAGTYTFRLTPE